MAKMAKQQIGQNQQIYNNLNLQRGLKWHNEKPAKWSNDMNDEIFKKRHKQNNRKNRLNRLNGNMMQNLY